MKRPWWWYINPWLALAIKERAHKDAIGVVREMAQEVRRLSSDRQDAERFRWLIHDHADRETRARVMSICESIPMRGEGGVRLDIDMNRWPPPPEVKP